jgi:glycosyltransferase involved in cell wall biosynthesis
MGNREVAAFYKNCSVFVLPSRSEGMSNALLEAMSYGMACISSKVSGSKDLIEDGYNGLLIEKDNITEFANALLYLFSNRELAIKLGVNARETITNHYQMDHIARKYYEIYKHIIRN